MSSPANTPAGNAVSALLYSFSSVSASSPPNTPAGSVVSALSCRVRRVSASSPPNTPAGSVVSVLSCRFRRVSASSPAKSPTARAVTFRLDSDSPPVMAARWVSVTLAQALTLEILLRIAALTASVRPQMPAAATSITVAV